MDADTKRTGRRISGLRSGLNNTVGRMNDLVIEAQEFSPGLVGLIEEIRDDAEGALKRDNRLSDEVPA